MKQLAALSTFVGIFAFAGHPALAQKAERVTFGCDAKKAQTCYFSILPASGGISNFTMKGGEREERAGMWPGKDRYIVTIDRPTPADWNKCQQQVGGWCKAATVKSGYNN